MIDQIEPALSAEDWQLLMESATDSGRSLSEYLDSSEVYPHRQIALSNAALPDSDPRKITREAVESVRFIATFLDLIAEKPVSEEGREAMAKGQRVLGQLAAALDSYLPPKG